MPESVNHPQHYNVGKIEVIDFVEAWQLDFCAGNAVKYIVRSPYKGSPLEDLKKARWYVDRLIQQYEAANNETEKYDRSSNANS